VNISRRRIESYVLSFPLGSAFRMSGDLGWPKIRKRLGRKYLAEVACAAKPATILAWCRRLIAQKFDGSKQRSYPGRPRISADMEALIVRMASENSGWGYDRIAGAH
jgi:putative transposase